jgi:hypothetical protein
MVALLSTQQQKKRGAFLPVPHIASLQYFLHALLQQLHTYMDENVEELIRGAQKMFLHAIRHYYVDVFSYILNLL